MVSSSTSFICPGASIGTVMQDETLKPFGLFVITEQRDALHANSKAHRK
jgi:hypothetical protein